MSYIDFDSMTYEELVNNALNTIGPNSVPESAGFVYAALAIANELKRMNDWARDVEDRRFTAELWASGEDL